MASWLIVLVATFSAGPSKRGLFMMQLLISPDGMVRSIYTEEINLATLGSLSIIRASHVEPDQEGGWLADLGPVGGPILDGFSTRSQALAAEHSWLEANWLR
jgi:hypothetical protein